ncbi:hypothetical protein A6M21_03475 [Desulfotomaculum copahuensis]|uniref:Uncharacterized protein n=1 Tax=Desulfotomaculum copahuensis TaxID=1838280 RepID=A0A1B7LIT5_9FIRM|nr:hypothetical protein A6M21_03475 [Desulfotomaculum copahuensis]
MFRRNVGEVEMIRLAFLIGHSQQAEGFFNFRRATLGTINLERTILYALFTFNGNLQPAF